jgi:hypothetical protein
MSELMTAEELRLMLSGESILQIGMHDDSLRMRWMKDEVFASTNK